MHLLALLLWTLFPEKAHSLGIEEKINKLWKCFNSSQIGKTEAERIAGSDRFWKKYDALIDQSKKDRVNNSRSVSSSPAVIRGPSPLRPLPEDVLRAKRSFLAVIGNGEDKQWAIRNLVRLNAIGFALDAILISFPDLTSGVGPLVFGLPSVVLHALSLQPGSMLYKLSKLDSWPVPALGPKGSSSSTLEELKKNVLAFDQATLRLAAKKMRFKKFVKALKDEDRRLTRRLEDSKEVMSSNISADDRLKDIFAKQIELISIIAARWLDFNTMKSLNLQKNDRILQDLAKELKKTAQASPKFEETMLKSRFQKYIVQLFDSSAKPLSPRLRAFLEKDDQKTVLKIYQEISDGKQHTVETIKKLLFRGIAAYLDTSLKMIIHNGNLNELPDIKDDVYRELR